ncbi:helix-turn-helix domain-containing protein [Phytobacter massiliensis]|uniref:helix-turn-helix domain-containing protein n=1 Tax=Phytobacter massiliensis TaxID=1485952 RepID=UPI0002E5777C|nr:AraC family transcriptional regulator [Phytobacter massiliensis]
MDSLSQLLNMLNPRCEVNLHCRFAGRWEADHPQLGPGMVPWHAILKGEARLQIAGAAYDVRPGDVLLLPQGSAHTLQGLIDWGHLSPVAKRHNGAVTEVRAEGEGEAVEVLCGEFNFGPDSRWLFADATKLIVLHTRDRQDCPELETLLAMLVRESLAAQPGGAKLVQHLAATFLTLLLRILLSQHTPPAGLLRLMTDHRLTPAVMAVLADPAQPWTIESLAQRCFLSRATFARHFAQAYHLTPQTWLTHLRMAQAARLLKQASTLTVETIAGRCGFASLASFSRAFKGIYGMTPARYRRY